MTLKINAKTVIMYIAYAVALVFINRAVAGVHLSLGLFFGMLLCGTNLITTPLLYVLASAAHLNWINSLISLFEGVFLSLVTFLYRRTKRKIRIEAAAYLIIALAPYIAFAPWNGIRPDFLSNAYALKAIAAAAVMLFAFFAFKTVYTLLYRTMRCRLKEDELICCAITYTAFGAGVFNLTGFYVYASLAVGALIFFVRLMGTPSALIAALILAFPAALINQTTQPLTAFIVIAVIALIFNGAGRFAPSAVGGACTALYLYINSEYDCPIVLIVFRALLLALTCILPSLPTRNYLDRLKNRLLLVEVLPDSALERSRKATGEKLYRISEVFREIECAFNALDEDINDGDAKERMFCDLKEKCCKNCERAKRCQLTNVYSGFARLIDAGCIKGRVNLIDLPSEITVNCANPTEVMIKLNNLLAEYRRYMTEAENAKSGRTLLADQARGVAEVMKSCATQLCKTRSEYSGLEQVLKTKLSNGGVSCPELYVNGDDMEINAVICGKADVKAVTAIISEVTKTRYILKDKICYDGEKSCFIFGIPPRLDAAFGVAYAIKSGEKVSGDTHSVIKINEHSFLMALSDGMGSGVYAKKVSATAISLIEAFYRAEMPEGTVLKTINKLLSFNRDERFTCIDIAAVNLNTGIAEFIKIGSPAGIIMREGEIKILESQSLPLGILDNLRPTVCTEQVRCGDIIVFMSDGITSAFSSSTELYEFLQQQRPLNPQNLADKILAKAKSLTKTVNDDMTVLCTRIFDK